MYSDLTIIDMVPGSERSAYIILASDGEVGGRHVVYEYVLDEDASKNTPNASFEWSEGLPTGIYEVEGLDASAPETKSLVVTDPTLSYFRVFPAGLDGAPSFYEDRFGISQIYLKSVDDDDENGGFYALYDAVPGLEAELRRLSPDD